MSSNEEGSTPKVVTGFQVRYQSEEEAFTTHQTFQPVDGIYYKVQGFRGVIFQPAPGYRIDTSTPEAPLVVSKGGGPTFQLNDAIKQGYVTVLDRWENPLPAAG